LAHLKRFSFTANRADAS
jgi:hypothetical protein